MLDDIGSPQPVLNRQGMRDGFTGCVIVGEPVTGATMERGQPGVLGAGKAVLQQPGKEMVVAVPTPLVVQGDDEQVGMFEIFQGFLPGSIGGGRQICIPMQNGITEGAAQAA